ncbi:heavy metal-associated domain-containing protein [Labilibacter sediminis]|nr:heavy metal-associated domain-containing protein [Labilibacter sediminis]
MIQFFIQFISELFYLLNAMSPYLLLGFFFAGVLKVWFPQKWIDRYMGKSNVRSAINTALIGIPLPLCSCGVIPTGISFYKNGASKGSSVSFLISTPQTGVDSVLVTYSLLGLPFALIRVVVALVTGVIGGVFTNLTGKNDENVTTKNPEPSCCSSSPSTSSKSITRVLKYGFHEFLMDIAKWLIIGILIAAGLSAVIPDDFFSLYLDNELLSMLTILLASVPLYLCATASVPIAAVLMMKGLSPGAALILLMAGPATNAATITIIKKIFGSKTLFSYLISIIGGAIVFGLAINHFLPAQWFQMIDSSHLHHQHELLPQWFKILSSVILVSLIIYGYIKKHLDLKKTKSQPTIKTVLANNTNLQQPLSFSATQFSFAGILKTEAFKVEGMTCSHCKASVETNLKKLDGINTVNANPALNKVEVSGSEINQIKIEEVINSLGYNFKGKL